jgi:hypothetical protein
VARDDVPHRLLVRQVGGDVLDLEAPLAQRVRGLVEQIGLARGPRDPVALLGEDGGELEADPPRGP